MLLFHTKQISLHGHVGRFFPPVRENAYNAGMLLFPGDVAKRISGNAFSIIAHVQSARALSNHVFPETTPGPVHNDMLRYKTFRAVGKGVMGPQPRLIVNQWEPEPGTRTVKSENKENS